MEILVHISAPTSHKDDERYRALAEAYNNFEVSGKITVKVNSKEQVREDLSVNGSEKAFRKSSCGREDVLGPAHSEVGQVSPSGSQDETIRDASTDEESTNQGVQPIPTAIESVYGSGISGRHSAKKLAQVAQAPDFGSFMDSTQTPIQQLGELESQWLHHQNISGPAPASRLPQRSNGGDPHLESNLQALINDAQQAAVAEQAELLSSFPQEWPTFSPIENFSEADRPSKRRRLSNGLPGSEANEHAGHFERQGSLQHAPVSSAHSRNTHPRTPEGSLESRILSSQMPFDYGLSNSQTPTPSRVPNTPGPGLQNTTGNLSPSVNDMEAQSEHNDIPLSFSQEGVPAEVRSTRYVMVETTLRLSQSSLHDETDDELYRTSEMEHVTSTDSGRRVEERNEGGTRRTTHGQDGNDQGEYNFAPLPIRLLSPPKEVDTRGLFDEMTSLLEIYVENASLNKHYRPEYVSRPIVDTDRGCWMFDTSNWALNRQYEFWTQMQSLLEQGRFGNVWCQRNIPVDYRSDRTDGNEARGLGMVWLFCWGQVAPHMWVVMLVESHLEIRKSRARWTVGPMEDLEVVVQMP